VTPSPRVDTSNKGGAGLSRALGWLTARGIELLVARRRPAVADCSRAGGKISTACPFRLLAVQVFSTEQTLRAVRPSLA
jgi:hypothetical protein